MQRIILSTLVMFGLSASFPQKAKALTPDETAMVLATLVVATKTCAAKTTNRPLNVAVAKLGQDLVDFGPNERYSPLVEVKMKKAFEFIQMHGKQTACNGMIGTVRRFLPGILR
ncbi:hypothetical protein U8607_15220 [Methylobacterium durans]|uniref:hypothetical protein n=1 Tax=Methylobacterium durans TaxID=2202825 RepID=UPI002AFF74A5|nr:hypothetical protein [Methylobacterium durans]MEA1833434.1 hypothetical protein [Methylobacterium durans]